MFGLIKDEQKADQNNDDDELVEDQPKPTSIGVISKVYATSLTQALSEQREYVLKHAPENKERKEFMNRMGSKPRKCVAHVDHCQRCGSGLGEYTETTADDYNKGEPDYDCDPTFETVLPGRCSICNKVEDGELHTVSHDGCVPKPQKSQLFKEQRKLIRETHGSCSVHDWHCAVCGDGMANGCGTEVKTVYTWTESQNVACAETDHYQCSKCDKEGNVLPNNMCDWSRKQTYLDYLYAQRSGFDPQQCAQQKTKKPRLGRSMCFGKTSTQSLDSSNPSPI